jgi:hypothetical protein
MTARVVAPPTTSRLVATYDYQDADGRLSFQVCRHEPKRFLQRCPDGQGGWLWRSGDQSLLYRLPELVANPSRAVFITEGERDADTLAGLGLLATTNPGGAGKWRQAHSERLAGRPVIVLPDNDRIGACHGLMVARGCLPFAARVKLLALPDLPEKGDVTDYLAAGHDAEDLKDLVRTAEDYHDPSGGLVARTLYGKSIRGVPTGELEALREYLERVNTEHNNRAPDFGMWDGLDWDWVYVERLAEITAELAKRAKTPTYQAPRRWDGDFAQRLKASIHLPDFLPQYAGLALEPDGPTRWKACCPFHGDTDPSLKVGESLWHCFGCGLAGDVYTWLVESKVARGFAHAVEVLAEYLKVTLPVTANGGGGAVWDRWVR